MLTFFFIDFVTMHQGFIIFSFSFLLSERIVIVKRILKKRKGFAKKVFEIEKI